MKVLVQATPWTVFKLQLANSTHIKQSWATIIRIRKSSLRNTIQSIIALHHCRREVAAQRLQEFSSVSATRDEKVMRKQWLQVFNKKKRKPFRISLIYSTKSDSACVCFMYLSETDTWFFQCWHWRKSAHTEFPPWCTPSFSSRPLYLLHWQVHPLLITVNMTWWGTWPLGSTHCQLSVTCHHWLLGYLQPLS